MYRKRIKIFIAVSAVFLLVCMVRLVQMQLLPGSSVRGEIDEIKLQSGHYKQLRTVRGKILDRNGQLLASDIPLFKLNIDYGLCSVADERVRWARLLKAARKSDSAEESIKVEKQLEAEYEQLQQVIEKCVHFGTGREAIEKKIENINNRVWNLRTFLAWLRNGPNQVILDKYGRNVNSVPLSEARADFVRKFPEDAKRTVLIDAVDDIAEIEKSWPLLSLNTEDDIFTAQLEFMEIEGVKILSQAQRFYPFESVASQTIGWVGPATQRADRELFAGDRLSRYLEDEVCGREDGIEYICESVLRGRRGEIFYDIDGKQVTRSQPQFGEDVTLTLDIELHQKIEDYLDDCSFNSYCETPSAVVVIDVKSADILALVSMPTFDLNSIRRDYGRIVSDPNKPLLNRAINKQYPPGSVVKPLILVAGLESGKINTGEVIGCPAQKAPRGWPSCWRIKHFRGHDDDWAGDGGNNARNAIKGSCNIYFSRLANRIEPSVLQRWLFDFGYGRKQLLAAPALDNDNARRIRQVQGQISEYKPIGEVEDFEHISLLGSGERRWFGIGQGNLRASPLQVANAMATVSRQGLYKRPRFLAGDSDESTMLNISGHNIAVIREGMDAVVNERSGTVYDEFAHAGFYEQGVRVYGKTGSSERPANAWFAGFAEDDSGRGVAVAVVVEGGQHGSSDAGPLARDIIQFCIDGGYVGSLGP